MCGLERARAEPLENARLGGPYLSIVHHLRVSESHLPSLSNLNQVIEKEYLSTVDAWVFNSETTRQSVENLGGKVGPYVVAYPAGNRFEGIKPEQIFLRASQDRPLQIVFVGSIIRRKGLHTLLGNHHPAPPNAVMPSLPRLIMDVMQGHGCLRGLARTSLPKRSGWG